jgi:hypothetical protein
VSDEKLRLEREEEEKEDQELLRESRSMVRQYAKNMYEISALLAVEEEEAEKYEDERATAISVGIVPFIKINKALDGFISLTLNEKNLSVVIEYNVVEKLVYVFYYYYYY